MPNQRAKDQVFSPVWMKIQLLELIDKGAEVSDLTRSQFIRAAVREKLEKMGIEVPNGVASAPSRRGRGGRRTESQPAVSSKAASGRAEKAMRHFVNREVREVKKTRKP